jgi:uncharacterized integral membrane protein
MAYQYKRRRPSILRNFWVYRRLIGSAVLLGLILWFVWANDTAVTVAFPFRLGQLSSTVGVVILMSVLVGSLLTFLIMTVVMTMRKMRRPPEQLEPQSTNAVVEDRPPPDYAAKTTEGFSGTTWSS